MSDDRTDRVLELAWLIEEVLQAASAGDYSGRCPVSIRESFADNPLTTITPSINLLLEDLQAKERAQRRIERMLLAAIGELETRMGTSAEEAAAIGQPPTPVIEVWDDVLALPVIGAIDRERGQALLETVLGAIARRGAKCVIVDVTGVVPLAPTAAEELCRIVRAGGEQGAYCVLTGARDELARTLAELGIEPDEVTTLATLKDGLASCRAHLATRKPTT